MKHLAYSVLLACIPSLAAMHLIAGHVAGQPGDQRIERILKDWQRRQEAVQRVRYSLKGHSIRPKGSQTDEPTGAPVPAEDVTQDHAAAVLLDFSEGRFRLTLNERL